MVKYYSVIKKNVLSLHELTWKDISYILNESDKMQSCLYNMIFFIPKSIHFQICPDCREMTWKNVLNEVFKLSKLIVSGKESEMGRKGMYGGRNKMKLNFHFLLFILWTCSTFSQMNENALLSLLFLKKISQIPLFPLLYFHSFLAFLNDMADKNEAQMTFSLSNLSLPEVFILNSRCFGSGSLCRLFLLELETQFPSPRIFVERAVL